jgi:hypothetical protein
MILGLEMANWDFLNYSPCSKGNVFGLLSNAR